MSFQTLEKQNKKEAGEGAQAQAETVADTGLGAEAGHLSIAFSLALICIYQTTVNYLVLDYYRFRCLEGSW